MGYDISTVRSRGRLPEQQVTLFARPNCLRKLKEYQSDIPAHQKNKKNKAAQKETITALSSLKLFLLFEKHRKTDNRAIY
jgi:hypothetical protein